MSRTKYLLSNLNLMNIMLAGVLIFLVNYMVLPFLHKGMQYSLPVMVKHEKPDSGVDTKTEQIKTPSPFDYVIIAEQNLFHPERKIPVEAKEAQSLPKPEFVLYGTLLSGDINIAYMEDKKSPYSTAGRGNRQRALKPGQSISGYTLTEVFADKVVMARGDDRLEVTVTESSKSKRTTARTTGATPKATDQLKPQNKDR